MFSMFKGDDPEAEKKRARAAYEKIVAIRGESRDARSARVRMALMCRAHLDKTFIAGAEQTATYQDVAALAMARGKERPPPPKANVFQKVQSAGKDIYIYLPEEFSNEAFELGAAYQRTEISAQQAVDAMQALADRVYFEQLCLDEPFVVLQFLRDEIAASEDPFMLNSLPASPESNQSGP